MPPFSESFAQKSVKTYESFFPGKRECCKFGWHRNNESEYMANISVFLEVL